MANRIQLRRGTAAQWTAANPVLAQGEPGIETDTGKQKFGNGTAAWSALAYASAGPQGAAGAAGVADDTSVKNLINTPGSATATALNATYAPVRVVDILSKGAVGDGAADDTAALTAAKAAAGVNGVVRFPAKPGATATTYYFAGSTPLDLTGPKVTADPGVVFSVDSVDFVNLRAWSLITPLTVYLRNSVSTVVLPPTVTGVDPLLSLSNALTPDLSVWSTLDFTTWDKRTYNYGPGIALGAYAAGTSTATTRKVTFSGTETNGMTEGVFTSAIVGDEVSVKVKVGNASGYFYAQVNSGGESLSWILPDAGGSMDPSIRGKLLRQRKTGTAAYATDKTITPSDPVAYSPNVNSHPIVAIRITSKRSAEFYVNGVRLDSFTFGSDIVDLGYALSATTYTASGAEFADPIRRRNPSNVGGRVLKLAVFGDSISFGASQSYRWVDMLVAQLRGQPGVMDVQVSNYAHSGDTTASIKNTVNTTSSAGFDYALVMTGTNDIGPQTAQATYEADLATIANKIVADGAVPIFGLFPMYAYASPGNLGPSRGNYGKGSYLRQALAWFCAANGYALADVQAEVGAVGQSAAVMPQLFDGAHPNTLGGLHIARAFARVIIRLARGTQATVLPAARLEGTMHVDSGTAAPTTGSWQVGDRRYNSAPAASGSIGWVCTTAGAPGTWKTFGVVSA